MMLAVLTYSHPTPASEHHLVRVAVGPSLSAHVAEIQAALGGAYEVTDVLAAPRSGPEDTDIAVLGTHELPTGEVLVHAREKIAVILVGLCNPVDPDADFEVVQVALVAAVLGLAARLAPAAG
jgi:hypothetical protein